MPVDEKTTEHRARLRNPGLFQRIAQLWSAENGTIRGIGGPLKSDPEGGSETQSIRFKASRWSVAEARKWLTDHKRKAILFEPATAKESAADGSRGARVFESVTQSALKVDREARLIRGVRIINEESLNGYRYSRDALREGVKLYEGRPVFSGHSEKIRDPLDADAFIVAPRYQEIDGKAGITADLDVPPGERGDKFLWLAEKHASSAGMSHDARVAIGEAA